jgi:hypothetical protein
MIICIQKMKINPVRILFIEKPNNFCLLYIISFLTLQTGRLPTKFCVLAEVRRQLSGNTLVKIRKIYLYTAKSKCLQ